jgi:mannose-6-phosphate isomerase-like protein (cupin superfamily)
MTGCTSARFFVTLAVSSCFTLAVAGAPQRGGNGEAPEAWWIEKPTGGQSAFYTAPHRPVWRLADLKKMHAGQTNWSQQVVLDDEQDATYNSASPGTKITTRMHPQTDTVFVVMAGQIRFTVEGQEPVVAKRGSIINILKSTLYSYEVVGSENALWVHDNIRGYGTAYPANGPRPTAGKGREVVKVAVDHRPAAYVKPNQLHFNTFDAITNCTVGTAVSEDRMYLSPGVNFVNPADDKCRGAGRGRGGRGGDDGDGPAGSGEPFNAKEPFGHLHSGAVEWWIVQAGGINARFEHLGEFHAVEGDVIYAAVGIFHQMIPEAPSGPSIRLRMGAYQRISFQNTGQATR